MGDPTHRTCLEKQMAGYLTAMKMDYSDSLRNSMLIDYYGPFGPYGNSNDDILSIIAMNTLIILMASRLGEFCGGKGIIQ